MLKPPTRQAPWRMEEMSADQRSIYERLRSTLPHRADGYIGGPFDILLLNPPLVDLVRDFGTTLWTCTSLDRGLVELVICMVAAHWKSEFEWCFHAPCALEHGISQEALDRIATGRSPGDEADHDLAYRIITAIRKQRELPREIYDEAVNCFGERGLAEILTVSGFYTMLAMNLQAFEVQVPPGKPSAFQ